MVENQNEKTNHSNQTDGKLIKDASTYKTDDYRLEDSRLSISRDA